MRLQGHFRGSIKTQKICIDGDSQVLVLVMNTCEHNLIMLFEVDVSDGPCVKALDHINQSIGAIGQVLNIIYTNVVGRIDVDAMTHNVLTQEGPIDEHRSQRPDPRRGKDEIDR